MKRIIILSCLLILTMSVGMVVTKSHFQNSMKEMNSGLKIEIINEGSGDVTPQKGQMISAHYTGWLTDGTKFDSSVDRGEPLSFQVGVGQVIKGWDEGLMTMKVGDKVKLHIPSHLAYGEQGAGGVIPPNADLVFEVELVSID